MEYCPDCSPFNVEMYDPEHWEIPLFSAVEIAPAPEVSLDLSGILQAFEKQEQQTIVTFVDSCRDVFNISAKYVAKRLRLVSSTLKTVHQIIREKQLNRLGITYEELVQRGQAQMNAKLVAAIKNKDLLNLSPSWALQVKNPSKEALISAIYTIDLLIETRKLL